MDRVERSLVLACLSSSPNFTSTPRPSSHHKLLYQALCIFQLTFRFPCPPPFSLVRDALPRASPTNNSRDFPFVVPLFIRRWIIFALRLLRERWRNDGRSAGNHCCSVVVLADGSSMWMLDQSHVGRGRPIKRFNATLWDSRSIRIIKAL